MDFVSAFRNSKLFSKEELIESFKLTMEYIEFDEDTGYTQDAIQKKMQICKKFLSTLEKCKLPRLTELWWYYEYEFTGDGIELYLCTADESDIELDEDSRIISSMSSTIESTLLKVACDYLTVEQFADIQGVSPVTVRQWIRRGKLRNAKKNGRDWLIPSLEDKPYRGYESVQYFLTEPLQIDEFPLVAASDCIWIHQDHHEKTVYLCTFANFKTHFRQKIELNRQEVERLELSLISSGKAKPGSKMQFVPAIKRQLLI